MTTLFKYLLSKAVHQNPLVSFFLWLKNGPTSGFRWMVLDSRYLNKVFKLGSNDQLWIHVETRGIERFLVFWGIFLHTLPIYAKIRCFAQIWLKLRQFGLLWRPSGGKGSRATLQYRAGHSANKGVNKYFFHNHFHSWNQKIWS